MNDRVPPHITIKNGEIMNINEIIEGTNVVVKVNKVETTAVFCGVSTKYPGYANVEVDGKKMPRKVIRVGSANPTPPTNTVTRNVAGHEVQVEAPAAPEVAADAGDDAFHVDEPESPHKLETMTKSAIRAMRADIEAALASVEQKYGVKVRLGNAGYDSTSVRFRNVEVVIGGDAQEVERNQFDRLAVHQWSQSLGRAIASSDYGKTFTCRGRRIKFIGCAPKSRKYCWLGRDIASNRVFKYTDSAIRDLA